MMYLVGWLLFSTPPFYVMRKHLLLPLVLVLLAPTAAAQSAQEVLDTMIAAYSERMEGVENYTITQQAMGFETQTYFEREEDLGPFGYRAYLVSPTGLEPMESQAGSPYAALACMRERAEYAGTETIDGERTHAIVINNFGDCAEDLGMAPQQGDEFEFELTGGTFYIDTDDHLIRRMTMEGTGTRQGQQHPITMDVLLTDYRPVGGMLHPYRMTMSMGGFMGTMSDEERRQMEEARRQLEQMPPEQRQMMERMMGDQLAQLEEMMAGGAMEMEAVVTDVRVNTGRPD